MLDAFLAGFTGSLYDDSVKKEEEQRKNREREADFNMRVRAAREESRIRLGEHEAKTKFERDNKVIWEGLEGDQWVTEYADGRRDTRQLDPNQYQRALDDVAAKTAAREQAGLLQGLEIERKRAGIAKDLAAARYSNERYRGGPRDEQEKPVDPRTAGAIVYGVGFDPATTQPDPIKDAVAQALMTGQITRAEATAYEQALRNRSQR